MTCNGAQMCQIESWQLDRGHLGCAQCLSVASMSLTMTFGQVWILVMNGLRENCWKTIAVPLVEFEWKHCSAMTRLEQPLDTYKSSWTRLHPCLHWASQGTRIYWKWIMMTDFLERCSSEWQGWRTVSDSLAESNTTLTGWTVTARLRMVMQIIASEAMWLVFWSHGSCKRPNLEIWQCCIIVKVATLRGLEKYAQIGTHFLIESGPECPKRQAD